MLGQLQAAARHPAAASALIRVLGAALTLGGVAAGIALLGESQFGISILVLAVGQIAAFPVTALERLLIRLVATGDTATAKGVMRLAHGYCLAVCGLGGLTSLAALRWSPGWSLFLISATATAACAGLVTTRQAVARAAGRLIWGQAPNELFRPTVTVAAYALAGSAAPENGSGALATLLASAATLALVPFIPRPMSAAASVRPPGAKLFRAMGSLVVVSAVAMGLERVFPLLVAAQHGPAEVAAFAVALRAIQVANFGQSFATFYLSPALAAALNEGADPHVAVRLTTRIRWLGLVAAIPFIALCLATPEVLADLLGASPTVASTLRVATIAMLAQAVSGAAQSALILAGQEAAVARIYLVGLALGLGAMLSGGADAAAAVLGVGVATTAWATLLILQARRRLGRWM